MITSAASAPVKRLVTQAASMAGGAEERAVGWFHDALVQHAGLNKAVGDVSGPFVKHKFNAPPLPGAPTGPVPLEAETIARASQIMRQAFDPAKGKAVIGIAGGGETTVHAFVVSDVTPEGKVKITQAIAQTSNRPENYRGLVGKLRWLLDKLLGNSPKQMKGVVVENWDEYAKRSERNSVVLLGLQSDPAKVQAALKQLQGLVGRPYDRTMTAAETPTAATEAEMYCTELSAWFTNLLKPGTVGMSKAGGLPVFQVADHMRASDVHGGPLKVLFNGENRLDLIHLDPHPHDAALVK